MGSFLIGINKGVVFMLISSIAFAFDAALAKTLSAHMDSIEIVFFRNLMIMIFLLLSTCNLQVRHKRW